MMNRRDAISKVALLFGATFSAPTLFAMEQAKSGNKITSTKLVFDNSEKALITAVAEHIIPKTETPGATDAGVTPFLIMMLNDCYKPLEQDSFKQGLALLKSRNFMAKSQAEQVEALKVIEKETKAEMESRNVRTVKVGDNVDKETMDEKPKGVPFWRLMKELTLLGYYTSEIGANASFVYEPIPGKYIPTKLKPGQKAYMYL